MDRDPLQRLVNYVATEANPHHLILQVASDAAVINEVKRLCRDMPGPGTAAFRRMAECCKLHKTVPDYFLDRVRLIGRILNLIPYEKNYYDILSISRIADREEIKRAFRRLSLSLHPDTNPGNPDAVEQFLNLRHAYEVLSNDSLRQSYDRNLDAPSWAEEETSEEVPPRPTRLSKWLRAWPLAALLLALVLSSSLIDFRQWQAVRMYGDEPEGNESPSRPVASPEPSARNGDLDQEIRSFVTRFADAYQGKDSRLLLHFFDPDAMENGTPVEDLMPVYEANFQRMERLRYWIDVGRWEMGEDEVMVDGSFSLAVRFWRESPVEMSGPIHLTLSRRDGNFAVKRLTYSFKESRKISE